jgi:hypothetical protein
MEKSAEIIDRDQFDSVWERVSAPPALPTSPETLPLTGLLPAVKTPAPAAVAPVAVAPAAKKSASNKAVSPLSMITDADREDEAARLRGIMERLAVAARECCALARRCSGEVAEVCRRMEKSCRASIRDLSTQYYILTGECFCPGSSVAPTCSAREALRRVVIAEAETREMCLAAAADTQFPSLETAYARAAKQSACRERAAEKLLGKMGCNA